MMAAEVPMTQSSLSRRRFAGALGAALGGVVAGVRPARAAAASLSRGEPSDLVQLNSNENPYGPSEAALAAMTKAQSVASRYPDADEEEMVEALARAHGVSPGQVVLGCGSSEILHMADAAFLGPGRRVVAAEPTFEAVLAYARVLRAEALKVPLSPDFRHDLARMAARCDERTGLVYVCNPNNPTGTVVTGDELAGFLAKVPPSVPVLVDEAYHHFVEHASYRTAIGLVGRFPNLIVARTFSKIHGMAGMRLGYAVGSEAGAQALRDHASWSNANAAVLAAARVSLADEAHVGRQRELLNGTKRRLCAELQKDGRRYIPSEANFLMIDTGADVKPVIEAFRARKILVGRRFPSLPTWLRVTIGTPSEMAAFLSALRELVPGRA
jgi:histidinol-phosphate aminotransferase